MRSLLAFIRQSWNADQKNVRNFLGKRVWIPKKGSTSYYKYKYVMSQSIPRKIKQRCTYHPWYQHDAISRLRFLPRNLSRRRKMVIIKIYKCPKCYGWIILGKWKTRTSKHANPERGPNMITLFNPNHSWSLKSPPVMETSTIRMTVIWLPFQMWLSSCIERLCQVRLLS